MDHVQQPLPNHSPKCLDKFGTTTHSQVDMTQDSEVIFKEPGTPATMRYLDIFVFYVWETPWFSSLLYPHFEYTFMTDSIQPFLYIQR